MSRDDATKRANITYLYRVGDNTEFEEYPHAQIISEHVQDGTPVVEFKPYDFDDVTLTYPIKKCIIGRSAAWYEAARRTA